MRAGLCDGRLRPRGAGNTVIPSACPLRGVPDRRTGRRRAYKNSLENIVLARAMALLDIRCRDVARILVGGPRTRREVGEKLREIYPRLRARGSWVRQVLLEWNPLVTRTGDDVWDLSDLGRALARLPGELGKPPTREEAAFLLGLLLLDPVQRRVTAELLVTGRSPGNRWLVACTTTVLRKLGVLERPSGRESAGA